VLALSWRSFTKALCNGEKLGASGPEMTLLVGCYGSGLLMTALLGSCEDDDPGRPLFWPLRDGVTWFVVSASNC
jgi:hypothetical protein